MTGPTALPIKVILFDFGGVLAEEGFREGLMAIARSNGFSPETFFKIASSVAYDSGYVVGETDESSYWSLIRQRTGITQSDTDLRREILKRFLLRPWMLEIVRELRKKGHIVGILSDQTQWLDELDRRNHFFREFDEVFNSYHLGIGKKNPLVFVKVAERLGIEPSEILFIDDNEGNVERARSVGFRTILFRDRDSFMQEIENLGLLKK
ncbi:MAG: HAD family phosphatase [Desulfomonilaceae bacterium]